MRIFLYLLLRRYPVEEYCDDCKYHVRKPECHSRRERVGMYEHLAESQEEDVGEGQGDTDADVPSDSSSFLL